MWVGRLRLLVSAVVAALLVPIWAGAACADVLGVWWSPDRDGKIELSTDGAGVLSGRIIAVSPEDAKRVDANNPDQRLARRPLLGLPFLSGFRRGSDGKWHDGKIYDPDSGQSYDGTLWFEGDRLKLRGFMGISLFGKTETFAPVSGPHPAAQQTGEPQLVHAAP